LSYLICKKPQLIHQTASQGFFTHQSQMKVSGRGLTFELGRRDVQWHPINRAKSKTIFEFFAARVASLHGNLLVLAVVNFGRGELA
jgi:hypothetical protein